MMLDDVSVNAFGVSSLEAVLSVDDVLSLDDISIMYLLCLLSGAAQEWTNRTPNATN